jgi:uncharacterized protein (DUF2384 family)
VCENPCLRFSWGSASFVASFQVRSVGVQPHPEKIPNRTLDRRFKDEVLNPDESDRLARVANILKRAQEVFSNVEKARDWMNTPLRALEGFCKSRHRRSIET